MSLHTSDLVLVPGQQLKPLDTISGFQVRPGFFRFFGATVIPGGVNFTIQSHGATSCELLLFHRDAEEPFAALKFPDNYKIGFVYSMIVFGLDIEEFEYAYRLDGPYDEKKDFGLTKTKFFWILMPVRSPGRASGAAKTIRSTATGPGSYRTILTGDWNGANRFPWKIL